MREIRTSGSMSGERKRNNGPTAQVTAPLLDSTRLAALAVRDDSGAFCERASWLIRWATRQNLLSFGT
jgi:hypothetical protein